MDIELTSQHWFFILVFFTALQRVWEIRLSHRNEKHILKTKKAKVINRDLIAMKLIHGSWLAGMVFEVLLAERSFFPWLGWPALTLFLCGQLLRQIAIHTLRQRWSVHVIRVHSEKPISNGIYRWIRHPNYLGVIIEIACLPLVYNAYITALVASIANAWILTKRIPAEEKELDQHGQYRKFFSNVPRFIPNIFSINPKANNEEITLIKNARKEEN